GFDPRRGVRSHFSQALLSSGLRALIANETGPATLLIIFRFDVPINPAVATVDLDGHLISPSGLEGDEFFRTEVGARLPPGNSQEFRYRQDVLKQGSWSVTAYAKPDENQPGFFPLTCQTTVPGSIMFDYTSGAPRCGA